MASKNSPSLVEAFPIVAQVTSFPLFENRSLPSISIARYTFEACANPIARGICPAVGDISEL